MSTDIPDDDKQSLLFLFMIVSILILTLYLPLELLTLVKIRLRIDLTSKIILAAYTLCFLIRMSINVTCMDTGRCQVNNPDTVEYLIKAMELMNSFADRIKWLILYLFIMEMQEVRNKIESETLREFQRRKV